MHISITANTIVTALWAVLIYKKMTGSDISWGWIVLVSVVWGLV